MTGSIAGRLEILQDPASLAERAADIIADRIVSGRRPFRLALSGGSTPKATYQALARRGTIAWDCVEIFFGDERFVPPDHPDSNYRMARTVLLDRIQPRKLYPIPTDDTPASAASRYDEFLRQQYGASTLDPHVKLFDLVLLGLGTDGHTASLLPGQPVLEDRAHWAAAVPRGRAEPRITLTYPALESSAMILFLVTGAEKAAALSQARAGNLPAGHLRPQGEVIWLADRAAAGA